MHPDPGLRLSSRGRRRELAEVETLSASIRPAIVDVRAWTADHEQQVARARDRVQAGERADAVTGPMRAWANDTVAARHVVQTLSSPEEVHAWARSPRPVRVHADVPFCEPGIAWLAYALAHERDGRRVAARVHPLLSTDLDPEPREFWQRPDSDLLARLEATRVHERLPGQQLLSWVRASADERSATVAGDWSDRSFWRTVIAHLEHLRGHAISIDAHAPTDVRDGDLAQALHRARR